MMKIWQDIDAYSKIKTLILSRCIAPSVIYFQLLYPLHKKKTI